MSPDSEQTTAEMAGTFGQTERGEVLVRVENLGKKYRIYDSSKLRLIEWLALGRTKHHRDFWALKGVSFELKRGERLGVVGMNGAGKSTLLQLVAGLLRPDMGCTCTTGNVAALLELGAGFHPDYTGRENILLAGQLRGLTRVQIAKHMDEIIDFAEVGEFIDLPLRTYSSGMQMRLAFSVATMTNPDVLILDEVLRVGDIFFQHKCTRRMKELTSKGTALIFVSHSPDAVRSICNRGLVLDQGEPIYVGSSERAVDTYLKLIREREAAVAAARTRSMSETERPGAGEKTYHRVEGFPPAYAFEYGPADSAEIINVEVLDNSGTTEDSFMIDDEVNLRIYAYVKRDVEDLGASFLIRDGYGVDLMGTTSHHYGYTVGLARAGQVIAFTFAFRNVLRAGHYSISAAINRLHSRGDFKSPLLIHQFDNAAGFKSEGLPDLNVYHRVYVPVDVQVEKVHEGT